MGKTDYECANFPPSEWEKMTEILVFSKHIWTCVWKWLWIAVCLCLSVCSAAPAVWWRRCTGSSWLPYRSCIFFSPQGVQRNWRGGELHRRGRRCAGMNSEEMRRSWRDKKRRVIMSSKYKCIKDITRCSHQKVAKLMSCWFDVWCHRVLVFLLT